MSKAILASLLLLVVQSLFAQQYYNDSAIVSGAAEHAKLYYNQKRGNEAAIYNGVLYHPYPSFIEGIAYFLADNWEPGKVVYDNILYENILMKYDLVTDQLVVVSKQKASAPLSLYSPRVKEFSFAGLKFIYSNEVSGMASLKKGIYQELVKGRASAYCKSEKTIWERISGDRLQRSFEEKKRYYIVKDNRSYLITTKKDLVNALKDQKKGVQDILKNKKMKFRINIEEIIIAVTEFYNKPEGKKL